MAAAALIAAPAAAKPSAMHVSGWARATIPGQTGSAAYLTIHNGGRSADRLISVSTPAARSATIHTTSMQGGVMRMRSAGPIAIAPNQQVTMKPGGLHIMLTGLKAPLSPGSKLPLTLRFAQGGTMQVQVTVQPPGYAPESHDHHAH